MTSSTKNIIPSNSAWNYNIQRYKNYDVHCEKDLISIIFLAFNKPLLTKICFDRLVKSTSMYSGEIEWILINNDCNEENYRLFSSYSFPRKVILQQSNWGINHGLNQGWSLSRGEYGLIMESDWFNNKSDYNFLQTSLEILNDNQSIDILQLRAIWDQHENWGSGKPEYWPWNIREDAAKAGYPVLEKATNNGYKYLECTFPNGFCNNPILMRKSLYRKCGPYPEPEYGTDPRHGETFYQGKVASLHSVTGHINQELFVHAGGSMRGYYESKNWG